MSISTEDHLAIAALVYENAALVDGGQASKVHELYVDDARISGAGGPDLIGKAAIKAWGEARQITKRTSLHVVTNLRFTSISSDTVCGVSYLTLYRHDGGPGGATLPFMAGTCDDVFKRGADGGWRFARRHITWLFVNDPTAMPVQSHG